MKNNNTNKGGYSVVELLFYISIFTVISIVMINSLIVMTKSFKSTAVQAELMQSASIMERITREVRYATSISSISATDLKLNTKDASGTAKTVEFLLSGTNIQLLENNTLTGNLNSGTISITALSFTKITDTKGVAVKISLTLKSTNDPTGRTVDFYNTAVLRGSYLN